MNNFKNLKYLNIDLYTQILQNKKKLETKNRDTIIIPEFVDKIIYVHYGLANCKKVKITEEMIGTHLGQYVFTRKVCKHKVKKTVKTKKVKK